MARTKLELPTTFHFICTIPIRITDINYGGHVGNDAVLSLMHEARLQFLQNFGYSEMNFDGVGMIMSDVSIEFKNEIFYGDVIKASIAIAEISKVSFALFYKLEKNIGDNVALVAVARTGMVCYNYALKKITAFPEEAKKKFSS